MLPGSSSRRGECAGRRRQVHCEPAGRQCRQFGSVPVAKTGRRLALLLLVGESMLVLLCPKKNTLTPVRWGQEISRQQPEPDWQQDPFRAEQCTGLT
ncbi:hypothetical protein NDU88_006521 [Pleurodeles waltl]|uniref:Uncharacterized protein n=1 Tax=Pleurodeles waltl TaxID=8319 RepID=A0AAV7UMR0_PLEWA|nr:hypothetical protein NDU88_006521 [Pleurodeles waltl]